MYVFVAELPYVVDFLQVGKRTCGCVSFVKYSYCKQNRQYFVRTFETNIFNEYPWFLNFETLSSCCSSRSETSQKRKNQSLSEENTIFSFHCSDKQFETDIMTIDNNFIVNLCIII